MADGSQWLSMLTFLKNSPIAEWHISFISAWWYKYDKLSNNELIQQSPISLCIESFSDQINTDNNSILSI